MIYDDDRGYCCELFKLLRNMTPIIIPQNKRFEYFAIWLYIKRYITFNYSITKYTETQEFSIGESIARFLVEKSAKI